MASSTLDVIINITQTGASTLRSVTGDLAGLGRTAAGIGVAGIAAVGAGLGALSVQLINAGSDAEEMQGKFDAVFQEFGGPVTTELTNFATNVGRSRFELMGFASTIQDTLVPLGFARGAAADMSVEVVKLATDLGSFNNLPTEQVIMDVQSALVGNTETLRKYGVVATQATIEQYALSNGLWDGEAAMDAQTKAAAIMGLIMDSTTDAQGDAARTSESWANQMRALKATLTDTATEIGLQLLPAVTPLLAKLGELASDKLPLLIEAMQPFIDMIVEVGQLLAEGDIEGALTRAFGGEMAQRIIDLATRFGNFITGTVIPFVQDHAPAIKNAFLAIAATIAAAAIGSLLMTIFSPLGLIIAGVALLAVAWTENWGGIQEKTETFRAWLVDTGIPNILDGLLAIQTQAKWSGEIWSLVHANMTAAVITFTAGFIVAWNTTLTNLDIAKQKLVAFARFMNANVWIPLTQHVNNFLAAINRIADAVIAALAQVNSFFNNLPSDLPGLPTGNPGSATGGNQSSTGGGTTVNNSYTMNVNGGDVGGLQNEFGAMASAAGGI